VGLIMAALLPGFAQAHLKRLAEGQDPGRCLGTMLTVQLALDLLLLAALGVAWAVSGFAPWGRLVQVFACMLGAQLATGLADIYLKVFLAREWVVPYALILLVARGARLVSTVLVLAWTPHITWVAGTFLLEGLIALSGAALVLAVRHGIGPRAPTAESFRGYWRFARPFLVTTPIALFQDSVDRVVVGRWAGLTAAGYYHIARALWEALSSVMQAPATLLFTRLSQLYARRSEGADREARGLFENGLDKLLFLVVPLGLALWAGAELVILALYGEAFLPAVWPLRLLVVTSVLQAIVNPYTLIVNALEETHRFIPVNLLRLAVYLGVLALLLGHQSGELGHLDDDFADAREAPVHLATAHDLAEVGLPEQGGHGLSIDPLEVALAADRLVRSIGRPWAVIVAASREALEGGRKVADPRRDEVAHRLDRLIWRHLDDL